MSTVTTQDVEAEFGAYRDAEQVAIAALAEATRRGAIALLVWVLREMQTHRALNGVSYATEWCSDDEGGSFESVTLNGHEGDFNDWTDADEDPGDLLQDESWGVGIVREALGEDCEETPGVASAVLDEAALRERLAALRRPSDTT